MAGQPYNGIERYIFADTYNLFLKYKDVDNNDFNWDMCIKDAEKLNLKYKNHPLARRVIDATMAQLEHIICSKQSNGLSRDDWEKVLEASHKMGW